MTRMTLSSQRNDGCNELSSPLSGGGFKIVYIYLETTVILLLQTYSIYAPLMYIRVTCHS